MMLLAYTIALSIVVLISTYAAFSWGYVLYKFWYWFLLPIFPDMPHINFYAAVGLTLFISLFKNHSGYIEPRKVKDMRTTEEKTENTIIATLLPWLTLVIGFTILQFIS